MSGGDEVPAAEDRVPEPGPGGPADRVEPDPDDLPPVTPDQPRSAQVEDTDVPDEIEEPEELDEGASDDATEEPPA